VRKISKTLAMMSLLAPVGASALGIGDIRLRSALNQTLDAEIPLVLSGKDTPDDVKISLAPPEAFVKAGIERHFFLSKLRFEALQKKDGSYAIRVSSSDVIREPFLNFLMEVNWPQGRMLREFTILLDPPAVLPETVAAETVSPRLERPLRGNNRAVALQPPGAGYPVRQAESTGEPKSRFNGSEYGPVRRDDTLWSIAKLVNRDPGVTQEQMVMALYRYNPKAFSANNVNSLLAGATLRVPDREFIVQVPSDQAREEFYRQQGRGRLTARSEEKPASPAPEAAPQAQLKLLAPSDSKAKGEAAVSGSEREKGKAKGDLALEVAETLKQENEEFRSRLAQFEERLADMQRLLSLKDEQIALLQAQQAPAATQQTGQTPATPQQTQQDASPVQPVPQAPAAAPETPQIPAAAPEAQQTPPAAQQAPTAEPPQAEQPAVPPLPTPNAGETVAATAPPQPAPPVSPPKATSPKPASKPVTAKPQATPPPKAEPGFWASLLEEPLYLGALGGSVALLGITAWLLARRRAAMIAETESILLATEQNHLKIQAASPTLEDTAAERVAVSKSSFLSDFSSSDFDALGSETDEVDPISEADVYLAYGRYKQAEELIRNAIEQQPQRDDCKLKLLEIHYATENRPAFEQYALELKSLGKDQNPDFWDKVMEMGRELAVDNPLFEVGAGSSNKDAGRAAKPLDFADTILEDLKQFELPAVPSPGGKNDGVSIDDSGKRDTSSATSSLDFDLGAWDLDEIGDSGDKVIEIESSHSSASPETADGTPALDLDFATLGIGKPETSASADDIQPPEADETPALNFDLGALGIGEAEDSAPSNASPTDAEIDETRTLDFDLGALGIGKPAEDEDGAPAPAAPAEEAASGIPSLDFDIDALDREKVRVVGAENEEDATEALPDIENLIAFDSGDLVLPAEPEESQVELAEKTIDDILRELTGHYEQPDEARADAAGFDFDLAMTPADSPVASETKEGEPEALQDGQYSDLTDMDELETKLDLAKAYADMEDEESARDILEEVLAKGNEKQKKEAAQLLEKLGRSAPPMAHGF
jgi:pilus assembly protein FimV